MTLTGSRVRFWMIAVLPLIAARVEASMPDHVDCAVLEVTGGGAIRIDANGEQRTVTLRGVALIPKSAAAINSMFARLRTQQVPIRCTVLTGPESSIPVADIEYLAWRDKSGDVWQDLAVTLLDEGLARPVQP